MPELHERDPEPPEPFLPKFGLIPSPRDFDSHGPASQLFEAGMSAPPLRACPPTGDVLLQVDQDCVANAGADAQFDRLRAQGSLGEMPSRRWGYYGARKEGGFLGQDHGCMPGDWVASQNERGWCSERWWAYEGGPFDAPPDEAFQHAADQVGQLKMHRVSDGLELRQGLSTGLTAMAGMVVDQAFRDYRGGVWSFDGRGGVGRHMVRLVGYEAGGAVYWGKNSWGVGWGASYPGPRWRLNSAGVWQAGPVRDEKGFFEIDADTLFSDAVVSEIWLVDWTASESETASP
jgi:hypothetical protein